MCSLGGVARGAPEASSGGETEGAVASWQPFLGAGSDRLARKGIGTFEESFSLYQVPEASCAEETSFDMGASK